MALIAFDVDVWERGRSTREGQLGSSFRASQKWSNGKRTVLEDGFDVESILGKLYVESKDTKGKGEKRKERKGKKGGG